MELANVPQAQHPSQQGRVRVATEADATAILRLLKTAPYNHVHVDWNMPVDWLGTPGFVVQQVTNEESPRQPTLVTQLLGPRQGLLACLAVAADPPPAAWVRVASVSEELDRPEEVLVGMLAKVVAYLREAQVTELGWLAATGWPEEWLTDAGFEPVNHIETYLKNDLNMPSIAEAPGLTLRPAIPSDMAALEEIEATAFLPIWRHSADSLSLALYQASSFDVAVYDGEIAGFQMSTTSGGIAHLVRLTVNPSIHGRGIGSALLARAIGGYREKRVQQISLNTQVDNIASQFLYRKFGFQASGQRSPLWSLPI